MNETQFGKRNQCVAAQRHLCVFVWHGNPHFVVILFKKQKILKQLWTLSMCLKWFCCLLYSSFSLRVYEAIELSENISENIWLFYLLCRHWALCSHYYYSIEFSIDHRTKLVAIERDQISLSSLFLFHAAETFFFLYKKFYREKSRYYLPFG